MIPIPLHSHLQCFCLIFVQLLIVGCGLAKAPDVAIPSKTSIQCVEKQCGGADQEIMTGCLTVSLKRNHDADRWVYWKAGVLCALHDPTREFVQSLNWDMRMTKGFPMIGSNGGDTARDIGGGAQAQARFAVLPDTWIDALLPGTQTVIQGLTFYEDRFESLRYQGIKLHPEYQNKLLNEIGSGIAKSYSLTNHQVELSRRIFVLRTADSMRYFALRFMGFDSVSKLFSFEWQKLK